MAIKRESDDRRDEAVSNNALGLALLCDHEPQAALDLLQRAGEIPVELDGDYRLAASANNTANALIDLDRPSEAVPLLTAALDGYRRLSIAGGEGDALRGTSQAHRLLGDAARAREFIQDAVTIARDHRNPAWEAFWSMEAGRVLVALGTPAEALVPYQRAASLQRQLDGRVREAAVPDASGEAYQALSRHQDAIEFHRYAVDTFRRFDER